MGRVLIDLGELEALALSMFLDLVSQILFATHHRISILLIDLHFAFRTAPLVCHDDVNKNGWSDLTIQKVE